jgi:hypothetical protein
MPQYVADVTIKELMTAEYTEMEITEFVEKYDYNNRLRRNFSIILDTIDEIGLNKKEYFKD